MPEHREQKPTTEGESVSAYIKTFAEIRKHNTAQVGGKGANLGELTSQGFPIPSGFVVTAEAYRTCFE